MRLLPLESAIFDDVAQLAGTLVTGAELLVRVFSAAPDERAELAELLSDLERRADAQTRAVVRRVASSFVTPFDRADLVALAAGLDDCVDALDEAAAALVATAVADLPPAAIQQVAVVQRQAEVTAAAMLRLRGVRDLADYWVEVGRLEHEAGRAHRAVLAALFATGSGEAAGQGGLDAVDVVWMLAAKEVSDRFEAAADAFERVARTVELIAAQEA